MLDKNLLEVIDEASSEASRAQRLHRKKTTNANFRAGSKGKVYCDKLQYLVFMLVNGTIPVSAPPEFLEDVRPLILRLLEHYDIGILREEFETNDT